MDAVGFYDPIGDALFRSGSGLDYWSRQVPILGPVMRSGDDARYWADYKKNTGKSPRYPGRTYSDTLSGVYSDAYSLASSMKRIYG